MSIDAMRQALEALEAAPTSWRAPDVQAALRLAIKQAERQEPVEGHVWQEWTKEGSPSGIERWVVKYGYFPPDAERKLVREVRPLYAAPPLREPLTDAQIVPMFRAREKMKAIGEKDAWYWYAWGISDGETAHGIGGEA